MYKWFNGNNISLVPPAHKSGTWLQILGITAGIHSYTSKAAIASNILLNPGGGCTSVLADCAADTPQNRRLAPSLTLHSHTSWTLQSRKFGRMFILPMPCRENQVELSTKWILWRCYEHRGWFLQFSGMNPMSLTENQSRITWKFQEPKKPRMFPTYSMTISKWTHLSGRLRQTPSTAASPGNTTVHT